MVSQRTGSSLSFLQSLDPPGVFWIRALVHMLSVPPVILCTLAQLKQQNMRVMLIKTLSTVDVKTMRVLGSILVSSRTD